MRVNLIALVGVVNIRQASMPMEIAHRSTSLAMARPDTALTTPLDVALALVEAIRAFPEPDGWAAIEPSWALVDATPGKHYTLPGGEIVRALRVGPSGEMIADHNGREILVMAADAIFGTS